MFSCHHGGGGVIFVVVCHYRTLGHFFNALFDEAHGLAHFFHPHQITRIAIAGLARGDVKI